MNRLHVIIIVILCFTAVPAAAAGDIVRHYDEHHNITGYTVIDGDRQTHYGSTGRSCRKCLTLFSAI